MEEKFENLERSSHFPEISISKFQTYSFRCSEIISLEGCAIMQLIDA